MHTQNSENRKSTTSSLQASVAGAGSGTLLILLAENLPEGYPLKSWLVLLAPTVTIGLTVFWKWLSRSVDYYLNQRTLGILKKRFKDDVEKALDDPNIPEDQKNQLRKLYSEFVAQDISFIAHRVQAIRVTTQPPNHSVS